MAYQPSKLAELVKAGEKLEYIKEVTGLTNDVIASARIFLRPDPKTQTSVGRRERVITKEQQEVAMQVATSGLPAKHFSISAHQVSAIRKAWRIVNSLPQ